jgi:hypothetical protein
MGGGWLVGRLGAGTNVLYSGFAKSSAGLKYADTLLDLGRVAKIQ